MNISPTDIPYVVSISRLDNVPTADKLKELKVSAVIVEVSDYYDSITHQKSKYPINTKLDKQIKYLTTNKIPYGVYLKLRSRTAKEVEAEIQYFVEAVKSYQIEVGVWVQLHLYNKNTIQVNDAIINKCRDMLFQAKYQSQIGLYCDKDQMKLFDWTQHSADWLLWIQNQLTTDVELNSLLVDGVVPRSFFKVI